MTIWTVVLDEIQSVIDRTCLPQHVESGTAKRAINLHCYEHLVFYISTPDEGNALERASRHERRERQRLLAQDLAKSSHVTCESALAICDRYFVRSVAFAQSVVCA